MSGLHTADVAALFADRSRVAMLDVLLDGEEHSVGTLAGVAGIAASTATEHLSRLEEGRIVVSRREGRRRLVRLAGPTVAAAYEALSELGAVERLTGLRSWTRHEALSAARTCYDHLAGRLGVAIADAAVSAGALDDDFSLAAGAPRWFRRFGIDVATLPTRPRPLLRVCTDWTERREHLAGTLGAAVCSAVLGAGWVAKQPRSRAVWLTALGAAELGRLGVAVDGISGEDRAGFGTKP